MTATWGSARRSPNSWHLEDHLAQPLMGLLLRFLTSWPQNPKTVKRPKNDSKVSLGVDSQVTQKGEKWLKGDYTISGNFRVAQEPNRNCKLEPSELHFPETESGARTAGTVFQGPKPEPELSFSVNLYWNTEKPFLHRNHRNRKPEPLEPFHPQTATEPNRTGDIGKAALQESGAFLPLSCGFQAPTFRTCWSSGNFPRIATCFIYILDGPAIRNANQGDSCESIRANRFAEKPLFS